MLSAIVIVGPENQCDERCADTAGKLLPTVNPGQRETPLVYVEALSRHHSLTYTPRLRSSFVRPKPHGVALRNGWQPVKAVVPKRSWLSAPRHTWILI